MSAEEEHEHEWHPRYIGGFRFCKTCDVAHWHPHLDWVNGDQPDPPADADLKTPDPVMAFQWRQALARHPVPKERR